MSRKNYKPNKFSSKNKYVYENINLWIKTNSFSFEYVEGEFINAHEKTLVFRCLICGDKWKTCWSYIQTGRFCNSEKCLHNKAVKRGRKKRLTETNNFLYLYPDLSEEWVYELNNDSPENYAPKSDVKMFWECPICFYKYKTAIKNRANGYGCPKCKSSKGEKMVSDTLLKFGVYFLSQHRFSDCRRTKPLPFDFYLPNHNLCIEYHGEQHYKPSSYFGGIDSFEYRIENDKIKLNYCNNKKINILVIPYWEYSNIEKILENIF